MEEKASIHAMHHILGVVALIGVFVTIGVMVYVVVTTALCTEANYVCEEDASIEEVNE